MNERIKIFSHNDLDGFGAPYLLDAVKETVLPGATLEIEPIGAGRIDAVLDRWLRSSEASGFTDVYIMDMTPEADYSFKELNAQFANHWLVFDHHETAAAARAQHAANNVTATSKKTPSAVSLAWDWLVQQPRFNQLTANRQRELAQLVELIRAYDTWDWQNDPDMDPAERQAADELNQLFWFYPLKHAPAFIQRVFALGWPAYQKENALLIQTLNDRRAHYLKSHLKDLLTTEIDGHQWGVVYADDYKSEIAHQLLEEHPDLEAAMVLSPTSVSLRANGKLDVAKFAEQYFHGGGHADAAGGRLTVNLIQVGSQAVIDHVKEVVATEEQEEQAPAQATLADNLDPELAAKMAALFKKD